MRVVNLENNNRKFTKSIGNFHVLEYIQDASVSPMNAVDEYFMSKMNVRRRQVVIDIDRDHSAVIQAGAMQWMGGNVQATSGVKGIGDLFGKAIKGAVTKETAVKPEYVGEGTLVLEPTYKYIILQDVSMWGANGMTIEDGMFLACDSKVKRNVVTRKNLSSAVLGGQASQISWFLFSFASFLKVDSGDPDELEPQCRRGYSLRGQDLRVGRPRRPADLQQRESGLLLG